jgi:RHS repeat-associated protein
VGGQGIVAAAEAKRANPEAVAEREASRTRFAGLKRDGAVALAEKTFGIQHPSWISPASDGTGHITKYVNDTSAVEQTASGKHLLVSSTVPLRSAIGTGRLEPTSLALQEKEGAQVPANPLVPISISKAPSGGVSLPLSISVAPEQAAAPEASVVVGDRVVYPGTATDTDYMAEPVPGGVETSWQLLSQASPQDNGLRFSLPAGASLQLSKAILGAAEIVSEGQALAVILPATAIEADGSHLSVSYSVSGDTLMTHVDLGGSIVFPVLVDPLIGIVVGSYGIANGADNWTGWSSTDSCGGCFSLYGGTTYRVALVNPGAAKGAYGQWYIYAPGAGSEGGAGITRVDLTGVRHSGNYETTFEATIGSSNGSNPVWTYNGFEGAQGTAPLVTGGSVNESIAFCAQGAGGKDGSEQQPLCNETNSGTYFTNQLVVGPEPLNEYGFYEFTGAAVRYLDAAPPNEVHLYGYGSEGEWIKNGIPPEDFVHGHDQGVGMAAFRVEIPPAKGDGAHSVFEENIPCVEGGFINCYLPNGNSKMIRWPALESGIHELGVYGFDAAGNMEEDRSQVNLYVDNVPPKITLSGPLAEHNGGVIGEGDYELGFSAEDGSTEHPQSGVESFEVFVDRGRVDKVSTKCPMPKGVPTPECFSLSGSWTIDAQQFGVGSHKVEVVAWDWAGNRASASINVTVNAAERQPVGPGTVNLKTGDYSLGATDVSAASADSQLTLSRVYDSRELTQGASGPLGPQWALSLPDMSAGGVWTSLRATPSGSVQVASVSGGSVTFVPNGSKGFTAPAGYQTLSLTESSENPLEYRITDAAGNATIFTRASSEKEEAPLLVPTGVIQAAGAGGLNQVTYTFTKTAEGIVEPTKVLAPYPSTIKCLVEAVKGCRELTFNYASATTATGEGPSEWGDYGGRLTRVYFTAWSPATKTMTTTTVAQYSYDTKGRLRAEWDPRVSPALKTEYGYDVEGHVTALTGPGQETWAFTYGTIAGDANTGRLLKVTQAPASAKLWGGQTPKSTEAPKLTGSAVVGVTMGASGGAWSNEPVAYSYQWEDCNIEGKACTAILGATNANYTITSGDVGHTLVAAVTATNGGGSALTASAASATVASSGTKTEGEHYSPGPGTTVEYNVPVSGSNIPTGLTNMSQTEVEKWSQKDIPVEATAIFPPDKSQGWPAGEYKRATVYYLDGYNRTVNASTPTGGISTSEYDAHDNQTRTLTAANRATALKEAKTAEAAEHLATQLSYDPEGVELTSTLGPEHKVKLPSGSEVQARKQVTYSYDEGAPSEGGPYRLITSTKEASLVAGKEEDPRTVKNSYSGGNGLGWKLHAPTSTITDPEGLRLTHRTMYDPVTGNVVEASPPAAETMLLSYSSQFGAKGTGSGQLKEPKGIALDGKGNLWVADNSNHRVEEFSGSGSFLKTIGFGVSDGVAKFEICTTTCQQGITGSGNGQFTESKALAVDSKGNVWVSDQTNNCMQEFNEKGEFIRKVGGTAGSGEEQFSGPQGVAIDSKNDVWVADRANNRVEELNESGKYVSQFGKAGIGNGEFKEPIDVAIDSNGYIYVLDAGNSRVQKFKANHEYLAQFGSAGTGNGQFKEPKGIAIDQAGNVWVADSVNTRLEEFSSTGEYIGQDGSAGAGNGQFKEPRGITINAAGTMWVVDVTNDRVEKFQQGTAHDTKTIYYTTAANTEYPACGEHPEWANLPCQTQPVHQPEVSGLPPLPVTTYTYNMWDEPEVTKSVSGETTTRTETTTYDDAGRLATKEIVSTTGTSIPAVRYEYSLETGLPVKQSTGSGSEEQKILTTFNTLGQMTSYTDADGKTATYTYENGKDARLKESNDAKGTQTYTYEEEKTGEIKELADSAAGKFTAAFDVEGRQTAETLPDGLTSNPTYNATGEPTGLEYHKANNCGTSCTWYTDTAAPSIHGQWISQTSVLGSSSTTQGYTYDSTGRLTRVQNTPMGKGCTTHLYTYDQDGNRTSLTTRPPGSEGKCATEGGTTEGHSYDTADRLVDPGIAYNPFGDVEALGAADAGGSELTSKYYVDGQLANQTQAGQTIGYGLDPGRRIRETVSTGKIVATETQNYPGPGEAPSWSSEPSGNWTRNIFGIGGSLEAIQRNGETPVLQLANLHGDLIATAYDSETPTSLASTIGEASEYGVPATEAPPKYSWLGAHELPTQLPSGEAVMGTRSYIPQLGRFLQPDPSPGGSANAYAYTHGNPINETDLSGAWTLKPYAGEVTVGTGQGERLAAGGGQAEGAITPAPVNAQIEAAFQANPPWDQVTAGTEEYGEYEEEWEEEGEEWEYTSYHKGAKPGHEEAHVEPALLVSPMNGQETSDSGEGATTYGSAAPLCKVGSQGPCRHYVQGCAKGCGHGKRPPNHKNVSEPTSGHACSNPSGCGRGGGHSGWKSSDEFCAFTWWVPGVAYVCGPYGAIREATK